MTAEPRPLPHHLIGLKPPFTLSEARKMLRYVRGIVRDMVAGHSNKSLVDKCEDELLRFGITVADRKVGRIHFPTYAQGMLADYCWTPEEDVIGLWHPILKCGSERWPVGSE